MITLCRTLLALSLGALLVGTGCDESDPGGMSSLDSEVRLASADVLVDGQSVRDATIPAGSGTSTLFCVTLANPADTDGIREMYMDYPRHSPMGMMGEWAQVQCYDDGTHGDPVPGDGTFCYLDVDGHVGPHRADCPRGEYLYTFHGTDMAGRETNALRCRVTVQ